MLMEIENNTHILNLLRFFYYLNNFIIYNNNLLNGIVVNILKLI